MKNKNIILIFFLLLSLNRLFSQRVLNVGYDFNNEFLNEAPYFKDLTLKENFSKRSALKIREIIKTTDWILPVVFSQFDSSKYNSIRSQDAIKYGRHGPIKEFYKYNSSGILVQYNQLPLYYTPDKKDSMFFNTITVSTDSIENGFIVNHIDRYGCGYKEVYINNLLIEERQIGCCSINISNADKNDDCVFEYIEYTKYKYSKNKTLIGKEYNNKSIVDGLNKKPPEYEKYNYKKNEVKIVKTPFHCSDCTKGNYYNNVKLNEYGKIIESKFWWVANKREWLTYYCNYDEKQNLTNVYYEFNSDHKKEVFDTFKYTYFEKKYKVEFPVRFEMYGGNKIIEFDSLGKITKITTEGDGKVETFEYK